MRKKLVVAGAWGLFDHFLALEKYPEAVIVANVAFSL